jgi:hypothetical protein
MYTVYQIITRYSDDDAQKLNIYRLNMAFSILALVSALDSHISPDSEIGGGYKDVTKSSIPLKRFLREQNVYLRYLHDEEITGKSIEGLDKILVY